VLQRPQGGYTDDSGRVYVTDVSRKAVFVFDQNAGRLLVWDEPAPGERFGTPVALAPGRAGELLVTDSDRGEVFRLATDGRPIGRFGKGVLGRPTGHVFDDDGRAVGTLGDPADGVPLNAPVHLAFASGMLYVVDGLEARVVVLGEDGKLRATIGKRGLYVGNLVRPKGVAVDDEGNVYVVESMYDRLLVFDAEGRLLLAIGGTGRDIGRFYLPAGVWVDARNRVYVADMFNGRVVVFQFLGGS
jgi:DNA-binding beta-propeller fold protein YncE